MKIDIIFYTFVGFCSVGLCSRGRAEVAYESPNIAGACTLEYELRFKKTDENLNAIPNTNFQNPSRVIISSDGNNFLWRMANGSWNVVTIYNQSQSLTSHYDSRGVNANLQSGPVGWTTAQIPYMPFPAAGVGNIQFLRSSTCTPQSNQCSGDLIKPGVIGPHRSAAYSPASIVLGQWHSSSVVLSCGNLIEAKSTLPMGSMSMIWHFSDFCMFKGVPIAKHIEYQKNADLVVNGQNRLTPAYIIQFDLIGAHDAPLPATSYKVESYLKTSANSIDDFSQSRNTSYDYNPKLGNLDAQRRASYAKDDQRKMMAQNGHNSDQSKTGIYALLALLMFGVGSVLLRKWKSLHR